MDNHSKKSVVSQFLEGAALFLLVAILIRIGVELLLQVWWVLIIAGVVVAIILYFRIKRNKGNW